ncbi:MAG: ribonuclease III [Caulobacteraceae bacterium]|nr:ribonuclease III [Caulobacteraceae bacterium]
MDRRTAAMDALQSHLGHVFADRSLLDLALTHASAGGGAAGRLANNERLEFLGDRVLGLAIAEALVESEREAPAGDLAKRFASLVSRDACARVARTLGLGEALRLAGGETRRGARDHDTILADACEAVIAALHRETGFEATAQVVRRLWEPLLAERLDPAALNPKSALQEWAAAAGRPPPAYRLVSRTGPDHNPTFVVEVSVKGEASVEGEGGSLQAAQKAAALAMLERRRSAL